MAHQQEVEASVLPRVASALPAPELAALAAKWVEAKQGCAAVALAALVGEAPAAPRIVACTFERPPPPPSGNDEGGVEPAMFGGV